MLKRIYAPSFLRSLKKIKKKDTELFDEVIEKLELVKEKKYHKQLKMHALKGVLRGKHAFSVNYKIRVICKMVHDEIHVLDIGDHSIYEKLK